MTGPINPGDGIARQAVPGTARYGQAIAADNATLSSGAAGSFAA